ncbi:MAG: lipase family protein [Puniceicoccales bacterium]
MYPERVPVGSSPGFDWPGFVLEDLQTAWHLATLSHAVYHGESAAQSALHALGWEWLARVEKGGVRADWVRRGEDVVLCGCGTRPREVQNLRHDLDAVWVAHPGGGRVHRGFADAWSTLRDECRNLPRPTLATGHSLGGALAILAAADFPEVGVMTFGSPRVGDVEFAKLSARRSVIRYQGAADAVCQLPPARLGFIHAGRLAVLADSRIWLDPAPSTVGRLRRRSQWRFTASLPWIHPGALWFRELADHAIHNYARLLADTIQRKRSIAE